MNARHQIQSTKFLSISPFFVCFYLGIFIIGGTWISANHVEADEVQSRTEANCTIGMVKGDTTAECHVPILTGCTVAQFPGYLPGIQLDAETDGPGLGKAGRQEAGTLRRW